MLKIIKSTILKDYDRYKFFERWYKRLTREPVPTHYPTDINLELTSYCNSKCTFCSHEHLIRSGGKQAKHMDVNFARTVLEKLRSLTAEQGIADKEIRLGPVGLGEPLLYPHFPEIVSYARELFPKAFIHANTNGLILKGDRAERLIGSGLDQLIISLCYNEPDSYSKFMGQDNYEVVVKNVREFLRKKGNRPPKTIIHIFDVPENRKGFTRFVGEWAPFLNRNDFAGLYPYLPLTDWSEKPGTKYPCSQLWNVIMVDAEGFVFPCCIGVWTKKDNSLCLGHITESTVLLLEKVALIRQQHAQGEFGTCRNCAVLSESSGQNKEFYRKVKKRWRS